MKKTAPASFAFLILIALSFSACKKKKCDEPYKSHFALAVGNTWTYEESYFFPDTASTPNNVRTIEVEIIKDTLIENDQLAYVVIESYDNHIGRERLLRYEVDGELRERQINSVYYSTLFKTNMAVGSKWIKTPAATSEDFNERIVVDEFPNFAFINSNAYAYLVQNGNPNLEQPNEYGEFAEDIFAPTIGVLESTYRINFFGPSLTKRILTDYYTK